MLYNYEHLIKKISQISGLTQEELDRRVEAKRAKLSGLISREGAAQIIASELGISFDKEKMKISELVSGMKRVNSIVKVVKVFPVRTFTRNGNEGKVMNIVIADDSGNTKLVLWDIHHIELFDKGEIKEGDVIEISNASTRDQEIHLGSFSELKKSNEVFENVILQRTVVFKKLAEARNGEMIKIRAFLLQLFDPRFFEVCPECKKKLNVENGLSSCVNHGTVMPEKRALVNIVVDDGSENMRAVLFNDQLSQIGLDDISIERFIDKKKELEGSEFFFSGNVRNNKMFNTPELIIDSVENVDLDVLLRELEGRKISS